MVLISSSSGSQPSSYVPRRPWRGRGRKRETTVPREESRQLYAWLPVIILVLVLVTLAVGGVALHYVEHYLIAATGDSLALAAARSEEHTSELQSPYDLVCRLLLEKKKT